MNYIEEILNRANIQQIRSFLIYGAEGGDIDSTPYEERGKEAWKLIEKRLEKLCPEREEYDKTASDIMHYACVNQDTYMEIGMRCGAMLLAQLLSEK